MHNLSAGFALGLMLGAVVTFALALRAMRASAGGLKRDLGTLILRMVKSKGEVR